MCSSCMSKTCEPCVAGWDHPTTLTFSHTIMRRNFRGVRALLRHLVSLLWERERGRARKKESRGWKELRLRLSEPVLARETTGKLMWHTALEPVRAAGKGEWALSFLGGWGGKSEHWLHGWCLLLRSERAAVWKVLQSAWWSADSGLPLNKHKKSCLWHNVKTKH